MNAHFIGEGLYLLEKILFAKKLAVAGKTLVVQLGSTFAALETLGVPCAL